MPNHVTSVITLSGDESRIKAMLEQIKNDEVGIGSVDFNKVLPMPEQCQQLKRYWHLPRIKKSNKISKKMMYKSELKVCAKSELTK